MRLLLSSYRAGKHEKELLGFLGSIKKVAVITNAKDYKEPQDKRLKIEDNFNYYCSLGLEPTEIDLRPFFNRTGAENLLDNYKFVWLAGGNVFLLRRALRQSGLEPILGDLVRKNEIILGGESAGAIIMGPTLKYSEIDTDEDSPNYIPEGYNEEVIWEGLDFINYVPVPHFQTPGYIEIEEYVKNLDKARIPYKTMTDNQLILINDNKEEFLG